MLDISEIFKSLQGEGPLMGRPATFIRLSGCVAPLCPWCDTPYAQGKGAAMTRANILAEVSVLGNDRIVITGGEPFRQWTTGLDDLARQLLGRGHRVQYETSGKAGIPRSVSGRVVCSPKFIEGRWHFDPENIPRVDDFKFVVADDFHRVAAFIRSHAIPSEKVWIMPRGATRNAQLARLADTWQFCIDHNFNLAPRLHTLAFDNKRGI